MKEALGELRATLIGGRRGVPVVPRSFACNSPENVSSFEVGSLIFRGFRAVDEGGPGGIACDIEGRCGVGHVVRGVVGCVAVGCVARAGDGAYGAGCGAGCVAVGRSSRVGDSAVSLAVLDASRVTPL